MLPDTQATISDKTFHVFGYPTTIVIDKAGMIRSYTLDGKIKEKEVRRAFQEQLVPVIRKALGVSLKCM